MKIKEILGLNYERNKKQALVFFLAYALILFVVYLVITQPFCWNVSTYEEGYNCAAAVSAGPGKILATILSAIFTLLVLFKRKVNVFAKIGLVAISGVLGFIGGFLLPLILISVLTTGERK